MNDRITDPLLIAAKAILYFMLGIIAFAGFFVVLGIPAVMIFGAELGSEVASGELTLNMRLLIALLLAGVAVALFLGWRFFKAMLEIVKSVGEGDPFVPANAKRLTEMAWITLGVNILALPLAGLGIMIAQTVGEEPGSVDASFDFGGVLMILVLFILARVFRHGTELREDLEGTV